MDLILVLFSPLTLSIDLIDCSILNKKLMLLYEIFSSTNLLYQFLLIKKKSFIFF